VYSKGHLTYPCCEYTLLRFTQPLPFLSNSHYSKAFNPYRCILFLHICCVLQNCWCSIILFSFPFSYFFFSFFFFFTLPVYSKPLPCQWGCRMTSRMSWPWVPQPCFLNSALGFSASSSSYCVSSHWLSLLLKMISYHLYVELIKSCTNHTSRIIVTSSYPNISNTIKHSSSLLPWNSVCHTEFLLFCIAVLLGCTYALL
jgi:hypothetical protein